MKILHACKHFYPRITGVTAYVEHLSREQRRMGHAVAVATWDGEGQNHAPPDGPPVFRARTGQREELADLVAEYSPDIVHVHSLWDVSHAAASAAKRLGRPYVATAHGSWQLLDAARSSSWRTKLDWNAWRDRRSWTALLRGAGAVIVLNAEEERRALSAGVAADSIRRIPNAVDVAMFRPTTNEDEPAQRPSPDNFTVLFVGALEANKGIFDIVAAAGLLRADHPDMRWLLCGDGPDAARLRQAVADAGLDDVIRLAGRQDRDRLPALYRGADAAVVPSHREAFSTVLLEAMASGLPCVGTAVGGTPEIIDADRTGHLIPAGNPQALADGVGRLARDRRRARAMGRAGREKAERHFAWTEVAARIETAYRLVLALLLACLPLFPGRPALAANVYPADMLTMVDPRNGRDVADGEMGWRARNPVWDGQTIRLDAARGETVAFQLVFLPEVRERLTHVRIRVELPDRISWRAYRVWPIWDVPEVAVPLADASESFDIPGAPPAGLGMPHHVAWTTVTELAVPPGTPPDRLRGQVRIDWDGGGAVLPLVLSVLPLDMPPRPAFVLEMNSYGDYLRLLPGDLETFLDMHRLFRHFRCTFTLVPYRQAGDPVLDFLAPALATDGAADFTAFDAALAGLFDGSAFADGQPLSHWLLPLRANWPAPLGLPGPEYARRNTALRRELIRHIRAKGWTATRFQEFHNENPEHGAPTPWRLDEPITGNDMAGHDLFAGFRRAACGDLGPECPLRYRIDISSWRPLRSRLQRLADAATDWSVSADPAFLDREAVGFFRDLGGQWIVAYGELPGFQTQGRPTPWFRFPEQLARFAAMGLAGYAQWQADRWQDKPLAGVPREAVPLAYSSAAGARDYIWPGHAFGRNAPLPSLRLFALREGLNLLDYRLLAGMRPDVAAGGEPGIPQDARAFYALKKRLSEQASQRCGQ